ncbi:restriction endonuclease subunit S [uncultured Thomasclavelia sp.]|uniref:restriction endonuclease subunit S n=1 Tax=uncultured Thomasclavelia sp. TaxID=3025759 RepID=UPI002615E797|nr:restriction endonuclease subunit S [uncultured Thomasclavelia sp.]
MSYVWEQRKLGDTLVELKSGLSRMLSNNDIGLPVIRANNINEGYLNMETDIKYWYEKDPQGADINNYLVSKGDILINFINSEAKMGTATVVQKVLNRKTIYTTNILKARVDENYDKYFWFTLTLTDKYKNDIKIITKPAVNQASFTTVDFKKLSYLFPNLKEQQKIGNYFSNLDRLITLHQRKILLYKYFFTIVWEQRKVHEIADRYDNLRVPVAAKFRTPGTTPYYGANGIQDFVEGYTHEGEFVLVAEDGANDLKNYPVKCVNGRIWVNNHAHVLQAKTQIADNKFLAYCISQAKIETFLVGGGRAKLNAEVMMDIVLYVPNLQEQKAIGHYLMQIDCLITLHRCKCIIYRKNMVNAWEQRKLSEFVDKAVDNRGKTPPLDENGTHPLIEVAALGGVHPDYSKIEKYLNDISFENSLRAYIKEGDILFTTVGSIGLVSLMDSREEAAIAQNIVAFRAKENFVPEYLYALFSNGENQYKATRIVMGAVQPSIKVSQLVDVEYMLTSNVKEQKKIGAYFSNLDHLITLHQWKCIVCTKIKVNTWIQCKFIKIGVKLQKCILLSIILLFKRRKVSCVFYVNILLRFIKVIELEVELVFVIIDGTIIVMFYLKIRCLYLNIFIFKINK